MLGTLASVIALILVSLVLSNGFLVTQKCRRRQHYTLTWKQGHRYHRKTVLHESVKDDSEKETWNDATVLSVQDACPSGKSLFWRVQVSPKLFDSYKNPGQFVQLRMNDKDPLFLAMCSSPFKEANVFEFLVKTTPNIPWLPTVKSGTNVQLTNIMGNGFALEQFTESNTCNVIMCVAGSGIAPIKACIESGKVKSDIRLYYGEWTANDLCFTAAYTEWSENVNVIPCLSRESNGGYRHGHVQDVLERQDDTVLSLSCTAILCGMPEMEESVRRLLLRKGIPEKRILTNVS